MSEQRVVGGSSLTGTLLGGRYELSALLGRGGMGEVYEAGDRLLGRRVAVKLLRGDLAGDPRLVSRFRREARTAASLSHPHVVAVHDFGIDGDRAYLVMELVEGRTLTEVIRAEAPLAPARAAGIAREMAEALAYAHARGVVHRDVAPGNVMTTTGGEVRVLDFGIARVDRQTPSVDATVPLPTAGPAPASAHGTVAYLAPEQARGEPADQRSDLYALGAVLYELLCGRPPFAGETAAVVAARQLHARPAPIREVRPDVPEALESIVLRCLAKDPGERHARAEDLAAELAAVAGDPARRPAVPVPPSSDRRARGGRVVTPVLATASTLVVNRAAPRRRGYARWGIGLGTVMIALALWFVALPVWHAMSAPPAVRVRVAAAPPLLAPIGVSSTGTCDGFWSTRIELAWTPAQTRAQGYEIYRSDVSGGPYDLVQRVPSGAAASWVDRDLGVHSTYYYVVRAFDGTRRSPVTAELAASTPLVCLG
jgi:hypothetical protein